MNSSLDLYANRPGCAPPLPLRQFNSGSVPPLESKFHRRPCSGNVWRVAKSLASGARVFDVIRGGLCEASVPSGVACHGIPVIVHTLTDSYACISLLGGSTELSRTVPMVGWSLLYLPTCNTLDIRQCSGYRTQKWSRYLRGPPGIKPLYSSQLCVCQGALVLPRAL